MTKQPQDFFTGDVRIDLDEPTTLEDISRDLNGIENELLLLNEKANGQLRDAERLLFFILIVLIYIAYKLS